MATKRTISISSEENSQRLPPPPPGQDHSQTITDLPTSVLDASSSSFKDDGQSQSQDPLHMADEKVTTSEVNSLKVNQMRIECQAKPEMARGILSKLPTKQDGFCRLAQLAPSKEGGYVQVSHGGANKFAILQEVLLWSKGQQAQADQHISHLCDKPTCVIPEHVCVETPKVNNSRKNCGMIIDCAHCDKKYVACKHEPKCIGFVGGFGSWEEFLERGVH